MPSKSHRALLLFLGLIALSVSIVRPPLLKRVALKLVEKRYGVRVGVGQATPHGLLEGVHLHSLQVWAEQARPDAVPLAKTRVLRVESGVLGVMVHPSRPEAVSCESLEIRLDFDEACHLTTALPKVSKQAGKGPRLEIHNWTLNLAQKGRPDFVIRGDYCALEPMTNGYRFRTTLNDPRFGLWEIAGQGESSPPRLQLALSSEEGKLAPLELRKIPFVPPEVWDQVVLNGSAKVLLNLDIQPERTTHHLNLTAKDLAVEVPIAGVVGTGVSGSAKVSGRRVTLEGIQGRCWGGSIGLTTGLVDFDKPVPELSFRITGDQVLLADILRQPWAKGRPGLAQLAAFARGKASGRVDLDILLKKPNPYFDAKGQGKAGLRVGLEMNWHLKSDQGRIHVEPGFKP